MLPATVNDLGGRIRGAVAEVTPKSNVTPGKKFIIGGIFVLLSPEIISNCKSDASENNFACLATFFTYNFHLPLIKKCTYPFEIIKLHLKPSVLLKYSDGITTFYSDTISGIVT
jgi:hypothetical protein